MSTVKTGILFSIASFIKGPIPLESVGAMMSASTFWDMKVSIWSFCFLGSNSAY